MNDFWKIECFKQIRALFFAAKELNHALFAKRYNVASFSVASFPR